MFDELLTNRYVHEVFNAHDEPEVMAVLMVDERGGLKPFYKYFRDVKSLIGGYDRELLQ